jgi:hypothetical protein
MTKLIGFKVFNSDWACRGFQYEVGKTYEMDEPLKVCRSGFHFCLKLVDCFNYYSFNPDNKVAEVEALGDIDTETNDSKVATNKIKILRELTWEEVLKEANIGSHNTGHSNSGNWNSGNSNSGDRNSGYYNSGDSNSGHHNSGHSNSGDSNSGDWNSGDWNSGDWNSSNGNNGIFNTEEHAVKIFDKDSGLTQLEVRQLDGVKVLNNLTYSYNPTEWISEHKMTDEEKEAHPEHKALEGYLKQNPQTLEEHLQEKWQDLSVVDKASVLSIPNFDPQKFKQITGIDVLTDDDVKELI